MRTRPLELETSLVSAVSERLDGVSGVMRDWETTSGVVPEAEEWCDCARIIASGSMTG
jgi:hypothetical protein